MVLVVVGKVKTNPLRENGLRLIGGIGVKLRKRNG